MSLERVRGWGRTALDLCFPGVCTLCDGELADGEQICWECLRDIRLLEPPFCSRCGHPVSGAIEHAYVCQQCTDFPPHFDRARAAGAFSGPLRFGAMALKYRRALWLVPILADTMAIMAEREGMFEQCDVICPVPLHRSRFRKRGFNQSEVLGLELSRRFGIPHKRLLRRIKPTPTQTRLSKTARRANVQGAFEACKVVDAKCIVLIDDVKTSGATVSECARTLKKAGAKEVRVLTLAHG